jgi:hypothetical protein
MKVAIAQSLLLDRILSLSLAERMLVADTGIAQASIRDAKHLGVLDGRVTLAQATRLAQLVGVTLVQLFAPPASDDATATNMTKDATPAAREDALVLIPLLHELPHLIEIQTLARTLDWPTVRFEEAMAAADIALASSGMALQRIRGQFKVRPANPVDPIGRKRVVNLRTTHRGLTQTEAAALYKIVNGVLVANSLSNTTRIIIGGLRNLDCIQTGDSTGRFEPTESLQLALPDLQPSTS